MSKIMVSTTEKESYRTKVVLSEDEVALVREVAEGIGCSRAAVVSYLLSDSLSRLAAIPKRSRVADIRSTRALLKGQDDFVQKVVRNASGPSLAYISTALDGLLTLARSRYDTLR